jgi:hypothetical protein
VLGVIVDELDSELGELDPPLQLSVALLFKSSKEGDVNTPFPLEELAIGSELSINSISFAALSISFSSGNLKYLSNLSERFFVIDVELLFVLVPVESPDVPLRKELR